MGIAAAAIAAAGTIAGSAIAGTAGAVSSKKANQANAGIQQMNNEFNAAEAQKLRDWQLEMWNRNNEYNTPAARRQRLEAGGYSPYADMSMNAVGGSVPGGSSASAGPSGNQQPIDYSDFATAAGAGVEAFGNIVQTMSDKNYKDASAKQINVETQYIGQKMLSEISKNTAEAKNSLEKAANMKIYNRYQDTLLKQQSQMNDQAVLNAQATHQQLLFQTALLSKELNGFDEKRKLELGFLSAQIFTQWQTGQLTFRQASTELVKQANIRQDTRLKTAQTSFTTSQDVEQKRATAYNRLNFTKENANLLLLQLKYQTERAYNNSGPDNWFQFGHANKKDGSYTGSGWYIDRSGKKILNWEP